MHQSVMQLQDNPDNRDTHIVGITVDEKKCLPDTKNHQKRTSFTCGQKYSYFNLRCRIKASSLQDKTEGECGILMITISKINNASSIQRRSPMASHLDERNIGVSSG